MRRSDRQQAYDELLAVIRAVRRRWRFRVLLRGAGITAGVALLATVGAAALVAATDPAPGTARWLRIGVAVLVALTAAWFVLRPLLRRVDDEAVALYLEEHEPSLEAAVLSALEARRADGQPALHDRLLARTLEAAVRRCHAIDDGRWIERGGLVRGTAALAGVLALALSLGFLAPEPLRRGAGGLFSSPRPAAAAPGVAIDIEPGDATVSRGADAAITARLRNFEAGLVELAVRAPDDTAFVRLPMAAGVDGFGYLLFDLDEDVEYYVEAAGVRSRTFTLRVAELPYARSVDLELVYPRYTGLPTRTIEDGGDIAALRGTTVRLRVTPTLPVAGGAVVVDGGQPIRLAPDSAGVLEGEFVVRSDGFYRILMDGPLGEAVEASPRYVIDALSDGPPIVAIPQPGRDERATAIDEVYIEARAEDDYGVGALTLHYAVNGGAARTVELYGGRGALAEVTAGHTLYLEEYDLEPGDLIAYWATATDNDAVGGRKEATSDIYFIQVRPFSRDYRAAEQGGMPGGGQQGEDDGDLTERQRQIIAATFNLVRDSADHSAASFRENLNTLALSQERLREQARTLAQRMVARQVVGDSLFRLISEILPRAADAMDTAAAHLRSARPGAALPAEQRALQHLQRAEAVFREVQVSLGQQAGGGGGGGSPNAEDLADLFELELDKLQDQYETVDRGGGADQGQPEIDETRRRLDELARRQQREIERRRREAMDGRGTGGGQPQRELADAVEEEARRLERLSRQQNRPELQEAARRLQDAAESMRRSAAGGEDGRQAMEGLGEARRLLDRSRSEGLRRDAESAARRADQLAREQASLGREAERVAGTQRGTDRDEAARRLDQRRQQQISALDSLQREMRRMAAQAGGERPEAARRLRDAADGLDQGQTRERIDYSRRLVGEGAPPEMVRRMEETIDRELERLQQRLDGIGEAFAGGEDDDGARDALDRARDLARGLESARERTQELRERGGQERGGENAAGGRPGGPATAAGTAGGGRPGGLDPDAARQLQREARERASDARALRDRLREQGLSTAEMDELLRGVEALAEAGLYQDPERLARIQTSLADQAKRLELMLRVRLTGEERTRLFLSGAEAVPPEYRELVEEYYRSLSREDNR